MDKTFDEQGGAREAGRVDEKMKVMYVSYPSGLHTDTAELVSKFAWRLAIKLRKAEQKYGYNNGWKSSDWMDECRAKLREHVEKGDPLDVAAYCAFLHWHGESTAAPASPLLPGLERHLDMDAGPVAICAACGRKSWSEANVICNMPQPNGNKCNGVMVPTAAEISRLKGEGRGS